MALTGKQEQFCREYIIDLNGTQAAIRAGYSHESARAIASENLTKPDVQARLQVLMADRAERVQVTADEVVRELKAIAFHRVDDHIESWSDGGTVNFRPIEDVDTRAISGVEERRGKDGDSYIHMQTHDKMKALELLGKHLKMWTDGAQITLPVPVVIENSKGETLFEYRAQSNKAP